jgi:hypothetical protein
MRIILTITIILSVIGCRQKEKHIQENVIDVNNRVDSITIDTSVIAIIQFDTTYHWLFENARPTELDYAELKQIEKILNECIDEYNPEQEQRFNEISTKYIDETFRLTDFIIELDRYKRQYVPVINEKGEKEIWINCFCGEWEGRDKNQILLVDDGGNCFFNLSINLSTEKYYGFMVNGVA